MKKIISLGLTFAVVFSALALTGCSGGEGDSAKNVVSVEPPKDAPLKPNEMGGTAGGSTGKAAEGTTQLPPP